MSNYADKCQKFINIVDVPTKLHLQQFEDKEGLQEYRELRTLMQDMASLLDIIINHGIYPKISANFKNANDHNTAVMEDEMKLTEDEFELLQALCKASE